MESGQGSWYTAPLRKWEKEGRKGEKENTKRTDRKGHYFRKADIFKTLHVARYWQRAIVLKCVEVKVEHRRSAETRSRRVRASVVYIYSVCKVWFVKVNRLGSEKGSAIDRFQHAA